MQKQILPAFLLHCLRFALSFNKIGCGSAKQNENPSAFLLLGSRLALSLSPQPKKRKYVCILPRHTCHVCHAALAVHHDCPPPSPHGRGGLLVAGGMPRTGCRGTRASGRLRPRKPLPPLLVRTVSSFCTTPVQPNRPLVEPARTVEARKFRCALFLLPIYLLWSAPQAQQVYFPSPAPYSR